MNAIVRAFVDQQINCVISFNGRLDVAALRCAMRALTHVEPILGCRFVVQGGKACWELREDSAVLESLSVSNGKDPDLAIKNFATAASRAEQDSLVQALLLHSESGDTLCIKVNHIVSDAAGVKGILSLLAELYSQYLLDPDYIAPAGTLRERVHWQLLERAGILKTLRAIPTGMPAWPRFQVPCQKRGDNGGEYAIRTIEQEQFKRMKQHSKRVGVTVNDVLLTAFFRALCLTLDPPEDRPLPVQVSVDLGYLLPEGAKRPVCNLAGALFPAIAWMPGEPFDATLARMKGRMDAFKKANQALTSILFITAAMALGYRSGERIFLREISNNCTYPLLSNIGIIDEQRLKFGETPLSRAFFLCPIMLGNGLMMCASTFRDTMTLVIGYNPNCVTAEFMATLMDAIVQELSRFV